MTCRSPQRTRKRIDQDDAMIEEPKDDVFEKSDGQPEKPK